MNPASKTKTIVSVIIAILVGLGVIGAVVALGLHNSSPEYRYNAAIKMGDNYYGEDDLKSALERDETARELCPERLEAYMSLAMYWGNKLDVDELFELYDLAEDNLKRSDFKKFEDEFYERMDTIIWNMMKNKKYDKAIKYVEMVAELDEDKAEEFREEYLTDIPWYSVVEEEPSIDDEPAPTEEPEPSEEPEKPLAVGYEVGEQVPDFEFYDAEGNRHTISEFRGKAVYINFFTTWCTYCFYELPDMEDVYDKYSDDVVFIMIDLAEGPELGLQYADDYDVTIPIYYVDDWEIDGLSIDAVPLSIVIDGNGVVYGNQLGQASYDWMDDTVNDAIESTK